VAGHAGRALRRWTAERAAWCGAAGLWARWRRRRGPASPRRPSRRGSAKTCRRNAPDAGAKRHVLRLEVSGEALATFREAMARMRRKAGEALDDDAAILLLCRQALEGPRDEGRSSYQVALTVCEHCRRGMQQGRGELVEVSAEIVEMAECDGQNVGHVGETPHAHVGETRHAHVGAGLPRATQAIPPSLRRRVMRRDGGRCRAPGCGMRSSSMCITWSFALRAEGTRCLAGSARIRQNARAAWSGTTQLSSPIFRLLPSRPRDREAGAGRAPARTGRRPSTRDVRCAPMRGQQASLQQSKLRSTAPPTSPSSQ